MTYLCVPILVLDPAQTRRSMALAAELGADMIELRLDHCTEPEHFRELIAASTLPILATCRAEYEGGHSRLSDGARAQLLKDAAAAGASCVDLELAAADDAPSLKPAPPDTRPRLILSHHNFSARPEKLYNLAAQLNASPSDINKLAWAARTVRDNLEVFDLLKHRQKPTIAMCMGEAGIISRVLCRKFGAFLTFAALEKGSGTAPGQVAVDDMKRLYRWDAIGPATRVYGVVGHPVAHSMSPAIHNACFDAIHFDGVYLPLLVEPGYESFKAFMESFLNFDGLDLSGLSITIPHKENALRYLNEKGAEIEPLAERIGAVNTIVVADQSKIQNPKSKIALRGFNTDYAAILDCITAALGIRREHLAGRRVAVIGAGGTGRTAVAALAHLDASVTIYNRTRDRAQALADEFSQAHSPIAVAALDDLPRCDCRIIVNTTSVGMHPRTADVPWPSPPALTPDHLVFDTIYNPMRTALLSQAQSLGARTVSGVEMFLRQAVGQFEAWTRHPAPIDVMRQVVESRLAARA